MARPIAPTPILYGKDAARFLKKLKEDEGKRVDKEYILRLEKAAKKFRLILKK